jgi:hypothetical protein
MHTPTSSSTPVQSTASPSTEAELRDHVERLEKVIAAQRKRVADLERQVLELERVSTRL